ncbi:hypothetical protein QJS10_CPA09g00761 [Acorus calamus]|uniref:Transcription factor MYC/MYB N-terminal domain-containing protein n=1 Tax=Acorus calamus TaxID=4465 RepID=A0AAV9E6Y7_ACOCL|nr:hypothetical protein QJS10_CPA09g00761 [Acorus calamus]
MIALHEALRNVCLNSDWTYSVFWTIRPRPRCRGGNGCKVGDDNGSLMLMWEDGFCGARVAECLEEIDGEDLVRKAFSKMSIQLYNYGEGLMGKVASDKCHKWVFNEPSECEPNINNYWQSSFDALPPEWTDQFASGIQTIAVIQAGHGLLQLGSCKIIPEDLHFVLRMRHTFESLGYQSRFYLSQLFSSNRTPAVVPPPSILPKQTPYVPHALSPIYKWNHSPNTSSTDHDSDIKWPNGLSFFNALTGRVEDAKLLFGMEADAKATNTPGESNPNEYLGLESQSNKARRTDNNSRFKRSFTLPARMETSSSSSSSLDQHGMMTTATTTTGHPGNYRNSEAGIYSDIMETFLD